MKAKKNKRLRLFFITVVILSIFIILIGCPTDITPDDGSGSDDGSDNDGSDNDGSDDDDSDDPVAATGVTISRSSAYLCRGYSHQLTAAVEPPDADDVSVSWESTDTTLATVSSNGLVEADLSNTGTVDINVTTNDGGFSDTCEVTVTYPGDTITYENGIGFTMMFVPGKTFYKEGYEWDYGWGPSYHDPVETVVSDPYWIAETEVTYELWYMVREWAENGTGSAEGEGEYSFANQGREGSSGEDGVGPLDTPDEPVTNINWRDAMIFCNALTEAYNANNGTDEDLECVYYEDENYADPFRDASDDEEILDDPGGMDNPYVKEDADGFRLLSSDEWNLAARFIVDSNKDGDVIDAEEYYPGTHASGADKDYDGSGSGDLDGDGIEDEVTGDVAVYNAAGTSEVKSLGVNSANALGLYDMSGNVWEWSYTKATNKDSKMRHGGGYKKETSDWMQIGKFVTSKPWYEDDFIGLRLGRSPSQ